MTAAAAVRELFANLPAPGPGKDLVWLADELVAIVQHLGSVILEAVRGDGDICTLECRTNSTSLTLPGRGPMYLFRPLLARLAKLGSDETGVECNPYGDRFVLTRSARSGAVRLEVEFANTPAVQRLAVTRVPVAIATHPAYASAPAVADPAGQPSL